MASDIYKFWKAVGPDDFVHPADVEILSRIEHPFDLKCLPACVWGRLRTAPVVLLYLSPGWARSDRADARSKETRKYYVQKRDGRAPLIRSCSPVAGAKWVRSRTKFIGLDWGWVNEGVAILNIGPYHSRNVADLSLLAALPSCRATLDWAQNVLFKEAIAGRRIVICMRSARVWGLASGRTGRRYGKGLFAPAVTRSGHMAKRPLREKIRRAAQDAIRHHFSRA